MSVVWAAMSDLSHVALKKNTNDVRVITNSRVSVLYWTIIFRCNKAYISR